MAYLSNDQPLQHVYTALQTRFQTAVEDYSFVYVWGLVPKLHVKASFIVTPTLFGNTTYVPIDITEERTQQYLKDACGYMRDQTDWLVTDSDSLICPIEGLEAYATQFLPSVNATESPWVLTLKDCMTFPVPQQCFANPYFLPVFTNYLDMFFPAEAKQEPGSSWKDTIGFDLETDKIKYIAMRAKVKVPTIQDSKELNKLHDRAEEMQEYLQSVQRMNAPGLGSAGYETSHIWLKMSTQEQLSKQAFRGVLLAVPISCAVVFCVTQSLTYTFMFLCSTSATILTIIGVLYSMGWTLDFNVSVMIIISCGFCTDFIIQTMNCMAHEYSLSMYGKVQRALALFSYPVFSSLVTTLGAGSFLYGSIVLLFPPFATYLMLSGAFGLFHGFVVLPAFSAMCGRVGGDNLLRFRFPEPEPIK